MRTTVAGTLLMLALAASGGLSNAAAGEAVELKSRVLKEAAYDAETRALTLLFHSGMRYTYQDVPADVFAGLKQTGHPGAYFHQHIRSRYLGTPDLANSNRPAPRRIRCVVTTHDAPASSRNAHADEGDEG